MPWVAKYILWAGLLTLPLSLSAATVNGSSPDNKTPDSTSIKRNHTVKPKLPTTLTNINASTGQQESIDSVNFNNLPPCPGDPSRTYMPGSTWPTTPNCPSISGEWNIPAGTNITDPHTNKDIPAQVANCPAACSSTRVTLPYGDPNPTSIAHASCPPGYVATASYNMQDNYRETTENEPVNEAPIFWADYVKYKAQGYICTANTPSNQGTNVCVDSDSQTYNTYAGRVTVGAMGVEDSSGLPMEDNNGYAGQWIPNQSQHPKSGFCYLHNVNYDCAIRSGLGSPHPGQVDCLGGGYLVKVNYDFYQFSCQIPAGKIIKTPYASAASVVCSRISTEWRSP